MVIPNFRENKGENLEVLLREYKRAYISTGLKRAREWLNFFRKFFKSMASHWFE
jgi:hypothetical protein